MRFVVDAGAVIEIVKRDLRVAPEHELLAPTLVRSQVLSRLHAAGIVHVEGSRVARGRVIRNRMDMMRGQRA